MTNAIDLGKVGLISNAVYNSITSNATAITSMSIGGASINATSFAGTANNANNLNGQPASYYTNATNISTGVLSPGFGGTGLISPGANGNVLTSNGTAWASAAPTGGGGGAASGMVFLSKVTASGASTADIETTFNSTYDNYVIYASEVNCSDPVSLTMLIKIAGSSSYETSSYRWAYIYDFRQFGLAGDGSGSANYITLNPAQGEGPTSTSNFLINVWGAPRTSRHKLITWTGNWTSDIITLSGAGAWVNGTDALIGVRFVPVSGTFSGVFRLYGIQNS
jgi:hypothetical protein